MPRVTRFMKYAVQNLTDLPIYTPPDPASAEERAEIVRLDAIDRRSRGSE